MGFLDKNGLTKLWAVIKAKFALKTEIPTKVSELTNDAGYVSTTVDVSGKANKNEVIPYYQTTSFDCNDTGLSGSSIYRVNASPANAANNNYSIILNFLDLGTPIQIQIPDASTPYVYKRSKSGKAWQSWFKMSAGDSDTVAGLAVHSGRNNEANKVVRTDGSGYIQAGYINSSDGDENNYSEPVRVWGTNGSDHYMRSYNAESIAVGKVVGTYSGNGGQQGPGYYGRNRVGFLMSNQPVNGYTNYTNWLYMDNYSGNDVGGATAIGVARTEPRAFIMQSDYNRSSWNNSAELISTYNLSSYAISNAGSNPTCGDGTAITQPAGEAGISIKTTTGASRDAGILYISQDNAYIANSSDNTYSFAVWDTDLTQNFSAGNIDAASFVVLEGGAGAKIRGNTVLHTGNISSYIPHLYMHYVRFVAEDSNGGDIFIATISIPSTQASALSVDQVKGYLNKTVGGSTRLQIPGAVSSVEGETGYGHVFLSAYNNILFNGGSVSTGSDTNCNWDTAYSHGMYDCVIQIF